MNKWQAFIDPFLDLVVNAVEYADATDEEIAELVIQKCPPSFRWPAIERRWLREAIAQRRGSVAPPVVQSKYAREKIAEIPQAISYFRQGHGTPTVSAVARYIGVDRGTLAGWVERGWVPLLQK
jgi:hypothetical protein